MSLSKADWELMEEVRAYYEGTRKTPEELKEQRERQRKRGYEPRTDNPGSINETANHFKMTRTKVIKILVTLGCYTSPLVEEVQRLRGQGLSVKDVSKELGIALGTVSSYLPYTDEFHNTLKPSPHTAMVREYRAYEKTQAQRTRMLKGGGYMDNIENWKSEWEKDKRMSYKVDYHRPPRITWENLGDFFPEEEIRDYQDRMKLRDLMDDSNLAKLVELKAIPENQLTSDQCQEILELQFDLGLYPGALRSRNEKELEVLSGERLPFEPFDVMRLHLELVGNLVDSDVEKIKKFGGTKSGVISRDLIVPSDMPLYALHYAIQRAFGWQNSHLHEFRIPDERLNRMCEGKSFQWLIMVGIIFRSPYMDEDAQFWADDYQGGSFKNWLRRKYTGPYLSMCDAEGLFSCVDDVSDIDPETELYVSYPKEETAKKIYDISEYDRIGFLDFVGWVSEGKPCMRPDERIEVMKFKDYPLDKLPLMFENNPFALIERVPISSVLSPGLDRLPDAPNQTDEEINFLYESTCSNISAEMAVIGDDIMEVAKSMEDNPINQVLPEPFTTELLYKYDFGDDWTVKISGSLNCVDLVEKGIVTQETLDKANIKCRETYRPVLVAREGEMVMDDVGGLSGFADFLGNINPDLTSMDAEERAEARQEKKELLEWAKYQGWKRNDLSDMNLM